MLQFVNSSCIYAKNEIQASNIRLYLFIRKALKIYKSGYVIEEFDN